MKSNHVTNACSVGILPCSGINILRKGKGIKTQDGSYLLIRNINCIREEQTDNYSLHSLERDGRSIMLPRCYCTGICREPTMQTCIYIFPSPLGLFVSFNHNPPFLKASFIPRECEESKYGGLGTSGDSGGAICDVKSRIVVSVAREEQSGGVWEHANQWVFHSRPCYYLLWTHHYLPHRRRCSHLHWIACHPLLLCFVRFSSFFFLLLPF